MSHNHAEASEAIEWILEQGYGTVFTGGGDGTIHQFINSFKDLGEIPRIGVLPLGTGNAVAEIVSSGDPLIDLRNFIANPSEDTVSLPLCESDGVTFAFGGLGLDAQLLNDYFRLNRRMVAAPARRVIRSLGGYLAATLTMTVPRMMGRWLRGAQVNVRITNVGERAYAIAHSGDGVGTVGRQFSHGEVFYDGPANATIFGTCPYYGYGMKLLPFAGMEPGCFHLRVSNVPTARLLTNMRSLWNGSLQDKHLQDFQVEAIKVEFSESMPYQIAGEAMGPRDEVTIRIAKQSVDLVRFI